MASRALSLATRTATRRTPKTIRQFSSESAPGLSEWAANRAAVKEHAKESTDLWRKVSFYVCLPAVGLFSLYVYKVESDHHEHLDHIKHENNGELPWAKYPYLNKRDKPFPWGDNNSLFFNKNYNKDMNTKTE